MSSITPPKWRVVVGCDDAGLQYKNTLKADEPLGHTAKFLDASEKLKPPIPISPSFSPFLRFLRLIRRAFAKGISARMQSQPDDEEPIPDEPFDDETLGGHITYLKFVRFMSVISIDGQEIDLPYEKR
ncbi:hypothetical protein EV421DRAFT_1905374 [Armillaria borealis]|uniref:Uncharacterized protein n=1 Tax=Armillaria borealis TaxID=47425 RepID=A0AA39JCH3_9AGAR|nr:hypothetical protein EV421DRAFT_1905374 [Armillaria borealis]